ncbi:unnamed protein product [marine sediment metagenome]|uniref:ParB-like N-terminal domain-containing protein n=1 Tax=marine sediment metagenome TaxID=412755 RepID=X1LLV4_9ZZZZ
MSEIIKIPISKIKVGEHDQRLDSHGGEIDGLAASIRHVGMLVPLFVEEKGDSFQLVSGHRRLLAAVRVGLSTVPCIVQDGTKVNTNEITFAENFFRKDLSPIELSCALQDCLDKKTMTVTELAVGFHRSEEWVKRMVAIGFWPTDIQEAIHNEEISVSAGSNLACVTDDTYRAFLVRNAVESGASARSTAAWLQAWRAMQPPQVAVLAEPVMGQHIQTAAVPQAPCLCCSQLFEVNQMSHVPVCGGCIQLIRQIGQSG